MTPAEKIVTLCSIINAVALCFSAAAIYHLSRIRRDIYRLDDRIGRIGEENFSENMRVHTVEKKVKKLALKMKKLS